MCQKGIDIIEEDWLNEYGREVLERLLWEHSRQQYRGEDGEMHHHHIYWATDMYEHEGEGFGFFDEIQIESVTGKYRTLVRPRADKSKEEQEKRTREKAEVFTPSWVCNAQNNLIDEAWFGRKDVFNHENDDHTWKPTEGKIEFPEGKTWKDYVCDTRMEITCGEAPYLASPYDTTTGAPIPLHNRIGLLDRKLRVIGENVETSGDWIYWAKCALKYTYGFEWQGDNLLLARESLLKTFVEYYAAFATEHQLPSTSLRADTLRTAAYIISWNIWQMDGLNQTLPRSGEHENEIAQAQNLFEEAPVIDNYNEIQRKKIYAQIAEWYRDGEMNHKTLPFISLLTNSNKKK